MKIASLTSRIAVGGVTAALATAGLVGATTSAATAAPVSSTYTCTPPVGSAFPVPVSVDLALPATGKAGFPIPAGLLSFNTTATIAGAVQTQLDGLSVNGARSADFGADFGGTLVKAPVKWTKPAAADGGGNWVYTGTGANGAFLLPKAGTYTVKMPTTFNLVATNNGVDTAVTAVCTTASATTVGSIVLAPQTTTITAKAPATAPVGKTVKVKGTIANEFSATGGPAASGKVTVLDGKKKVGTGDIKNGKFKVSVKGLKAGNHKLTVVYGGDDYSAQAKSAKLKLKVTA